MARCNCDRQVCACVVLAGDGASVSGSGTVGDPYVITATGGGGGGGGGFDAGDLKAVAHGDTPAGWLECLGQAVSRSTYATLFATIGTTYGVGDGSTTFNLPSYSGRALVGAGPGYVLGAAGGASTTTLLTANLPIHTHSMSHTHGINHDHGSFNTAAGGAHDHQIQTTPTDGASAAAVRRGTDSGTNVSGPIQTGGSHSHTVNVPAYFGSSGGSSASNTGPTGAGAPFNNQSPYRVARVLIKT